MRHDTANHHQQFRGSPRAEKASGPEIIALWQKFEEQATAEARTAKVFEIEAQLQHNEAGRANWDPIEIEMVEDLATLACDVPIVTSLRDHIVGEASRLVNATRRAGPPLGGPHQDDRTTDDRRGLPIVKPRFSVALSSAAAPSVKPCPFEEFGNSRPNHFILQIAGITFPPQTGR